jgi:hypothetical protein
MLIVFYKALRDATLNGELRPVSIALRCAQVASMQFFMCAMLHCLYTLLYITLLNIIRSTDYCKTLLLAAHNSYCLKNADSAQTCIVARAVFHKMRMLTAHAAIAVCMLYTEMTACYLCA